MWNKFYFLNMRGFLLLQGALGLWVLLLSSCEEKNQKNLTDPSGRLTSYISESFNVKSVEDKARLVEFLTDDVKIRLENWSEDQFREFFVNSKRKFLKLFFREIKEVSASEVQITYELVFLESDSKVTQKKLCQMLLKNAKWYIARVKNITELIEYQEAFSVP